MSKDLHEPTSPIRLITSISSHYTDGISLIYEDNFDEAFTPSPVHFGIPKPKVGRIDVWFDDPDFQKICFVDTGENCIVWEFEFVPEEKHWFITPTPKHIERTVKEIRLRREVQLAVAK